MSTNPKRSTVIQAIGSIPQKIIGFVSGAITRIFGPNDDDYPTTGTQPFEGEPPKKSRFRSY